MLFTKTLHSLFWSHVLLLLFVCKLGLLCYIVMKSNQHFFSSYVFYMHISFKIFKNFTYSHTRIISYLHSYYASELSKILVNFFFLYPILKFLNPNVRLSRGKVMVHKSFPYAPCMNTSQPLDFLHTLTIWSHTHLWSLARLLRPDFHLCSPLRRDLSSEVARISPATFLFSSKTIGNH